MKTRPGWRSRKASRSNSLGLSATSLPRRRTRRAAGSSARSPTVSTAVGRPACRDLGRPPRAAQQGPHAGQQLAHREGLGDVVVRPHLQPHHPVDLVAPRRDIRMGTVRSRRSSDARRPGRPRGRPPGAAGRRGGSGRGGSAGPPPGPRPVRGRAHLVALAAQGVAEPGSSAGSGSASRIVVIAGASRRARPGRRRGHAPRAAGSRLGARLSHPVRARRGVRGLS